MKKISIALMALVMMSQTIGSIAHADNEDAGTIIGGILGGLIGNQFGKGNGKVGSTIAGAVIGAVIGNQIGQDMDEADRRAWAASHRRCLDGRLNERYDWDGRRYGSDTGARGEFYAIREGYHAETREVCREYRSVVYHRGHREEIRGYACRTRTTWREVKLNQIRFEERPNSYQSSYSEWFCVVRNERSEPFRARATTKQEASARALNKCDDTYSRSCRVEHCEPR